MNELPPIRKQQTSLGAFFKWATIGFLGLIAMLLIFAGFLFTRMFPLIQTGSGSTKFFGGSLEVRDHDEADKPAQADDWNGPGTETDGKPSRINGSLNDKLLAFALTGTNGRVEIKTEKSAKPRFECEVRSNGSVQQTDFITDQAGENVGFNFDETVRLSWCRLVLPEASSVKVKLTNGDIELKAMRNPVDIEVTNGRITFAPENTARFDLKAATTNGMVMGREAFDEAQQKLSGSPTKSEIFGASLRATNGVIIIE